VTLYTSPSIAAQRRCELGTMASSREKKIIQ